MLAALLLLARAARGGSQNVECSQQQDVALGIGGGATHDVFRGVFSPDVLVESGQRRQRSAAR